MGITVSRAYGQGIAGGSQPVGLYSSFSIAAGLTIPASGGVTVSISDLGYLADGQALPVVVQGISGTLSRAGSVYTFTRFSSGSSASVSAGTVGHALGSAVFTVFTDRPTTFGANDAGKTYVFSRTGNLHRWTGTAWIVLSADLNVLDFGAVGNGVTDDTPAFTACLAAVSATRRRIIVPAGVFNLLTGLAVTLSDIIIEGLPGAVLKNGTAGYPILNIYNSNAKIRGIRFETNLTYAIGINSCPQAGDIQDCTFVLDKNSIAIFVDNSSGGLIENNLFSGQGRKAGMAVRVAQNCDHWRVYNNTIRYTAEGIIVSGGCQLIGNHIDGGYYSAVADYTGTATYTATTLTASGAGFAGFDSIVVVRLLNQVASGTHTEFNTLITDTSKNFVTLGIQIGDFITTPDCIGIVSDFTATTIRVEQWLTKTSREPHTGAGQTSYTAHRVYTGRCINYSYTASTVTVQAWWDNLGNEVTPPNTAVYEICKNNGGHQVLFTPGRHSVVATGNTIKRPYGDGIAIFNRNATVTGNTAYFTQDMGITIQPDGEEATQSNGDSIVVTGNTCTHNGSHGIYVGWCNGAVVTANRISDTAYHLVTPQPNSGIYVERCTNSLISSNLIGKQVSAKMDSGFFLDSGTVTNTQLADNVIIPPLTYPS